jgi:predicted Rossmann fold nucleotide-binding protein DprA/Smf involved in DNA uptake
MIKVIIAGSRDFDDYDLLERTMDDLFGNEEIQIISGGAKGADRLGEHYAAENGLKVFVFGADWDRYGKQAGAIRNKKMAQAGTHLVAFWDGKSKGTKMMIDFAGEKGIKINVIQFNN